MTEKELENTIYELTEKNINETAKAIAAIVESEKQKVWNAAREMKLNGGMFLEKNVYQYPSLTDYNNRSEQESKT